MIYLRKLELGFDWFQDLKYFVVFYNRYVFIFVNNIMQIQYLKLIRYKIIYVKF